MTKYKIFVYGSLMKGEFNHSILERGDNKFIRSAQTTRDYNLFDLGGFPGMTRPGNHSVIGEVYEVCSLTVAHLDILESHPQFYKRSLISLSDGEVVSTYILDKAFAINAPFIKSGNWKTRK